MTLKELAVGKTATVLRVGGEGVLRQHFLDMGWSDQRAQADSGNRSSGNLFHVTLFQ